MKVVCRQVGAWSLNAYVLICPATRQSVFVDPGAEPDTFRDVVLGWPDETICYPGHGSHLHLGGKGAEIERFLQKNHGNFYGDARWGM